MWSPVRTSLAAGVRSPCALVLRNLKSEDNGAGQGHESKENKSPNATSEGQAKTSFLREVHASESHPFENCERTARNRT
jgi:hypothetical protein